MKLKDIFESSKIPEYDEIYQNLKNKYAEGDYFKLTDFCEGDYSVSSGYAKKTYSGKLKEGMQLTELELSMICDNGYSHFGGSSHIGKDGSFSVTIYTD